MKKMLALFQIGTEAFENGMNILGGHIDSPRLDLKQNPLYESDSLALLETHYYGGVKKYQWVARPMALHGIVVKKDGTSINVSIGEKDDEPVVGVSDLLIHLAAKQMELNGQLRDTIVAQLTTFNQTKGYQIIFSNTMGDNILLSNPAYDITAEFLEVLNKNYSSGK